MFKKRIVIDTDIGDDIDDAFALALLLNSPEIEIAGITTVYKNACQRASIVLEMLRLYGRNDIPVIQGRELPLIEPVILHDFETVADNGRPDIAHYHPSMPVAPVSDVNAADYILSEIERSGGETIVLAIGPLTNIAEAYLRDRKTFLTLKQLVIMGGTTEEDRNEWNIRCDPEAAKLVFTSGVPIRMIGFNVTKQCEFTGEDLAYFRRLQDPRHAMVIRMMEIWIRNMKGKINPVMHDPLAAAILIHDFCTFETKPIEVTLRPDKAGKRGFTLIRPKVDRNCGELQVAVSVDRTGFIRFLKERICE